MPIVTGDTKVVQKGKGDGVFINTTGVGVVPEGIEVSGSRARPGDAILVSGTMGDHGVAIMSLRENLTFETTIASDTAALHGLVEALVTAVPGVRTLRDPTRGGLATTLNEIARQSGVGMTLREAAIPVRPEAAAACEFLGLDPRYVANEGKLVAIVAPGDAPAALAALRMLSEESMAQLNASQEISTTAFRMPDDLWVRVIYDTALSYHARVLPKDHLLKALTPVYLGRTASFVLQSQGLTTREAEHHIESLCRTFESRKEYLVTRWP